MRVRFGDGPGQERRGDRLSPSCRACSGDNPAPMFLRKSRRTFPASLARRAAARWSAAAGAPPGGMAPAWRLACLLTLLPLGVSSRSVPSSLSLKGWRRSMCKQSRQSLEQGGPARQPTTCQPSQIWTYELFPSRLLMFCNFIYVELGYLKHGAALNQTPVLRQEGRGCVRGQPVWGFPANANCAWR